MLSAGELIGDVAGVPIQSVARLEFACFVVVMSYLLLLGPVFEFFTKLRSARLRIHSPEAVVNNRMGVFLLIAQLAFLAFNVSYGVNVAGSGNVKADTSIGLLWVLLPVDSLFMIYYAACRKSRFWWLNLAVYVISNVVRGWLGMFFFIVFMEWCRLFREKRVRLSRVVGGAIVMIVFYPVVLNLKWAFRAASSDIPVFEGISSVLETLSLADFFQMILDGIGQVVARLQITSLVEQVIAYSDRLQSAFGKGMFKPFWLEGLHGVIFDKMISSDNRMSLGTAFTAIGNFGGDFDVGSWNTNTGWIGWFFVAPGWIPFFLLYTAVLGFLSVYFVKKIGETVAMRDLLWFAWLAYLVSGWLGSFVGFIHALLVFLLLKFGLSILPDLTWARRRANGIGRVP